MQKEDSGCRELLRGRGAGLLCTGIGCWKGVGGPEPRHPPATSSPSNLSNNKVSEIEDGAFEGAASVSELHLTANQLESIRSGMFRGLDGLRTL